MLDEIRAAIEFNNPQLTVVDRNELRNPRVCVPPELLNLVGLATTGQKIEFLTAVQNHGDHYLNLYRDQQICNAEGRK